MSTEPTTTDVGALAAAVCDGELTTTTTSPALALSRLVLRNQLTDTQRKSLIALLMSVNAWLDACPAAVSSAYAERMAVPEPEEPRPGGRFDRWRLCAHADDSRPAHWLAPGDRCVSPALSEDH